MTQEILIMWLQEKNLFIAFKSKSTSTLILAKLLSYGAKSLYFMWSASCFRWMCVGVDDWLVGCKDAWIHGLIHNYE